MSASEHLQLIKHRRKSRACSEAQCEGATPMGTWAAFAGCYHASSRLATPRKGGVFFIVADYLGIATPIGAILDRVSIGHTPVNTWHRRPSLSPASKERGFFTTSLLLSLERKFTAYAEQFPLLLNSPASGARACCAGPGACRGPLNAGNRHVSERARGSPSS
jgi:hypothetical protein